LRTIADGLTARGFDVTITAGEQPGRLDLTNVRGALCQVELTSTGTVTWQYRPFHGTRISPAQIASMVMRTLGVASSAHEPIAPIRQHPGLGIKGAVGRALAERNLNVRLQIIHQDDVNFELYAAVEVTNLRNPTRGHVHVGDDSAIHWHCHLYSPAADINGLPPADISATIATALAGHNT
jgi:hypothetical protein